MNRDSGKSPKGRCISLIGWKKPCSCGVFVVVIKERGRGAWSCSWGEERLSM